MRKGKVHLAYSRFLGYKKGADGRPEIVEDEAAIVRDIYDWYISGDSINTIASRLTDKGIPTPAGKTRWSVSTIKSILSNEKYKGEALLQKTYTVDYLSKEVRKNTGEVPFVRVRNSHEPIIDPEVFNHVQELLNQRKSLRSKVRTEHPFAGKIICGECGATFGHKVWRVRSTGEHYDVWYCNHKYDGEAPCTTPPLRESEIKDAFAQMLEQRGDADAVYSDARWRELVETLTVYNDYRLKFLLAGGNEVEIAL